MNCDQVFDALTRGPFPTGNDALDERVERHLGHCGSCRRLAAALQPAVELFEEAVSPEESCGLPAYWGELFSEGDAQPTTRTRAPRLLSPATDGPRRPRRTAFRLEHAWQIAAALLVGMAVGGVMRAALREPDQPNKLLAAGDRDRSENIASWNALGMTAVCGPLSLVDHHALSSAAVDSTDGASFSAAPDGAADNTSPSAAIALARQKCCTECHHSGGALVVAQVARARIASSCEICHVNAPPVSLVAPMGGGE